MTKEEISKLPLGSKLVVSDKEHYSGPCVLVAYPFSLDHCGGYWEPEEDDDEWACVRHDGDEEGRWDEVPISILKHI